MNKFATTSVLAAVTATLLLSSCATYTGQTNDPNDPNRTQRGALIGAGIGAVAGLLSGHDAVGGLDFGASKEPTRAWTASVIAWWKRLTQPAPKRSERREDTIAILDFDGPAR